MTQSRSKFCLVFFQFKFIDQPSIAHPLQQKQEKNLILYMYIQQNTQRKNSPHFSSIVRSCSQFNINTQQTLSKQQKSQFRKRSLKVKNIRLDEVIEKPVQKHQQTAVQLKLLADIVKRKQKQTQINSTEELPPPKTVQQYHYYDSVVRNLISEIRNRGTKESTSSAIQQKPIKFASETFRIRSPLKQQSPLIKLSSQRTKMVFSLSLSGSDTVYQRKITSLIEFLYKLNFSNCIYMDLSLSMPKYTTYKIKVGLGNNGLLVKSLLKRRFWLEMVSGGQCNFVWTQLTDQSIHESQISTEKKKQISKEKPISRKPKLLASAGQDHLKKILRKEEILLTNEWYQRSDFGKLSCYPLSQVKKVSNHLPLNCIIGAKRILFKVMSWYYREILDCDPFDILPVTYNCQGDNNEALKKSINVLQKTTKVWIVKPGQNSNRGNGIKVMETSRLINFLNRQKGRNGTPLIIQEYIKPFLYCGRKFDIRHYLLLTSVNGWIKAYWYKQGYIRTSSQKYDIQDLSDEMIHLTNDAVQKRGDNYGKYQPANKLSYSQFQRYLDTTYPHKHYSFQDQILNRMKEITTDLIRASFQYIDPLRKNHNFQLYGLDFYISNKFRPYLIECNANPCLQVNCPILERIIPGAIQHAFRIGLDPLFPPPTHYPPSARYQLCDKIIEKLKYELIFDEKLQGNTIRQKSAYAKPLDLSGIGLRPQQDLFQDDGSELAQGANLD